MISIEFINKEIKAIERSYKLVNNRRDANKLMQKLIHLRQVKKELMDYNALIIDYQISLDFQEAQKEEMQSLRKELDVERWRGIAYWEDFKKLKKFALHFKKDIQEGLKENYRRGENIVYDSLLNEFGESFLKEVLKVE